MNELFIGLNWTAIIVGTVLAFVAGHAWYSPKTFGTKWTKGNNISMDTPPKGMAGAIISQLISTFLLALLIGITAREEDLFMAILILLTVLSFICSNSKWAQKPKYVIGVDIGFIIFMFIIMVGTHAVL